jgi:hypothetical protein
MVMHENLLVGLLIMFLFACHGDTRADPEAFWDTWGDDQAEVSAYRLTQMRYGEPREGEAVLIYVAEPQTRTTRVKPDPGNHPESDIYYVLKLNHLRTFQTGVYPYRIMTSSFAHVDLEGDLPRGALAKVAFSAQEWCGNTFHQLILDGDKVRSRSFSYFDREADRDEVLDRPARSLIGDGLFIYVRDLFGELPPRGESQPVAYLPSAAEVRLEHKPLAWSRASVSVATVPERVSVPAGSFEADVVTIESEGRPTLKFWVESAYPHRIVRWEGSDGEQAELKGSQRLAYWKLNGAGDVYRLGDIGACIQPDGSC